MSEKLKMDSEGTSKAKIGALAVGALVVGTSVTGVLMHESPAEKQANDLAVLSAYKESVEFQKANDLAVLSAYKESVEFQNELSAAREAGVASVPAADVASDNIDAIKSAIGDNPNVSYDEASGAVIVTLPAPAEPAVDAVAEGYTEDEFGLGDAMTFTVKHNKMAKLFDGTISFDGDKLDVHEEIIFTPDMRVAYSEAFDKELGADVAMAAMNKGGIKYVHVFDEAPDWSEADHDKPVTIDFAGKKMDIVAYDGVDLEVMDSKEGYLGKGEVFEGITLVNTGDNSVMLQTADGKILRSCMEGHTVTLGDIDVNVKAVFEGSAYLAVGERIFTSYKDGDAVTFLGEPDDSTAEWVWDFSDGLGMRYNKRLDAADEVKKSGEYINLPNSYVQIRFNGAEAVNPTKYELSFDKVDIADVDTPVLKIVSDKDDGLTFDVNDYSDELVWDGAAFLVWDDNVNDYKAVSGVKLGDSGLDLESDMDFGGFHMNFNLADEEVLSMALNGVDMDGRDYDVVTQYGITLEAPGDLEDLNSIEFSVPEEALEASVTLL